MKYSLAPFDTVLEVGDQFYVVKVKGAKWAQHTRRDGGLLGVTDIAADQEVEVIGKINVDANADEPKPKRKPKSDPVEPVRLDVDTEQGASLDT